MRDIFQAGGGGAGKCWFPFHNNGKYSRVSTVTYRNEMKVTSRFYLIILVVRPYVKAGTDILVPRRRKVVNKSTESGKCLQKLISQMHFPCDSTVWWVPGGHSAVNPSYASSLRVD